MAADWGSLVGYLSAFHQMSTKMQRKTNWQQGYKIKARRACNSGRNSPLNMNKQKKERICKIIKSSTTSPARYHNAKCQWSRFHSRFSVGAAFGRAPSASASRRTPRTHWPPMRRRINRPVLSWSCRALEKNYWGHRRRFGSEQGAARRSRARFPPARPPSPPTKVTARLSVRAGSRRSGGAGLGSGPWTEAGEPGRAWRAAHACACEGRGIPEVPGGSRTLPRRTPTCTVLRGARGRQRGWFGVPGFHALTLEKCPDCLVPQFPHL